MSSENEQMDSSKSSESKETNSSNFNIEEFTALKDEVSRLRAHHEQVLAEKKDADAKRKAAEDKAKQDIAEKEGNWREVIELTKRQFQEELEKRDAALSKYESEKKDKMLADEAHTIARELASTGVKASDRAALLAEKIKARLKMTEDGIKITDSKGNLSTDTTESLKLEMRKQFDFLCDAVDSGGSGAKGTIVGGVVKNLKDMSEADLRALYRANPEKYRELVRQSKN